jgi:hypothetical protein
MPHPGEVRRFALAQPRENVVNHAVHTVRCFALRHTGLAGYLSGDVLLPHCDYNLPAAHRETALWKNRENDNTPGMKNLRV